MGSRHSTAIFFSLLAGGSECTCAIRYCSQNYDNLATGGKELFQFISVLVSPDA